MVTHINVQVHVCVLTHSMYVCMYVCIYLFMYVYVCMYVCIYVCCVCVCMYACMYVCMYVCMYMYVCMCVYASLDVYMYVHKYGVVCVCLPTSYHQSVPTSLTFQCYQHQNGARQGFYLSNHTQVLLRAERSISKPSANMLWDRWQSINGWAGMPRVNI